VEANYRRARPDEIPLAADLFLVSVKELAKAHGLPAPVNYTRAAVVPVYEHLFQTGIFEVAEVAGQMVGFAAAIVRDEIWFLAMFWVLPEFKLRGIGKPLLERVRRLGEAQGATLFCTWSSIDFAAVASYLKLGLLPGGPIFTFAGPVRKAPEPVAEVSVRALDSSHASAIDQIVRGTPRPADHSFFRSRQIPGFEVEVEGRTVGYFYAENGVIGPAAWLSKEAGPRLLSCALGQAKSQAAEVKFSTLGSNTAALQAANAAGLRLVSSSHFLRTAEFGKLDQYLPSGPALL
jgi:GNAT superfamily N-acetyltransferase